MMSEQPNTPGKPETTEIATIDRDITKTPFGRTLRNEDDTLLTRGAGKGLKIYDELERDPHVSAVVSKRKLAVVARNWDITSASDAPLDLQAAELVRENFDALQLDRITQDLLDATLKGFAVGEILWAVDGNRIVARDIVPRDQRRFVFDTDHQLHMLTRSNLISGEPMPERKFIVHSVGAKDGSPYGLGLGSKLFWPVFFKRNGLTFWLTFADKFGSPTAVGKYPRGTLKPDQDKLLTVLQALAQDAGVVIPEGMIIELMEATRTGSTDTYERLLRYLDEQISEAVLGETMSTSAQGAGLGSGQANVHNEVRIELAKADADLLSDTLNNTLVRWLVDFNFSGAGYPKFYRNFDKQEDLAQRAERDTKIYGLGYEPDEQYILDTYGPGWKKRAPGANPFGGMPGGFPAFAEAPGTQRTLNRDHQAALADAAESLAGDWQQLVGKRVEDLVAMLEETGDLATFRERMDALLGTEPPADVVEAFARAGFAAHLIARGKAPAGNGDDA